MVFVIPTISYFCDSMSKIVLFTLTDRVLYSVIYVVANPVHGLLDWTRSEEHLQSYNESIKAKQNKKQGNNNNPRHMPENDRRRAL